MATNTLDYRLIFWESLSPDTVRLFIPYPLTIKLCGKSKKRKLAVMSFKQKSGNRNKTKTRTRPNPWGDWRASQGDHFDLCPSSLAAPQAAAASFKDSS